MLKIAVILLIALSHLPKTTPCVAEWNQCGGLNYAGETSCCGSLTCEVINPWYYQCLQGITTTTRFTNTTASTARPTTTTARPATTTARPTTTTASPTTTTTKPTTTTARPTTTTVRATTTTATPTTTTVRASTTTASTSSSTTQSQTCQALYGQCGGLTWSGSKTCCAGGACVYGNDYYYQCLPSGNPATTPSPTASTTSSLSTTPPGNDGRQSGVTTRYWDCCKASCGWSGKASVTNPVRTCDRDGLTPVDPNAQSICNGGNASMCNNQQPWSVSNTLSYGYAAAHISGQGESQWCCACYSLLFTSGPVQGKEMIVQVTNTGGDLGSNHFDIQMPGGGVGIFDGCSSQFRGSYSWGQQYGGVSSASDCAKLPVVLQPGCNWRFNWFQNADNPSMRFKQVPCPSALTANTQCVRL